MGREGPRRRERGRRERETAGEIADGEMAILYVCTERDREREGGREKDGEVEPIHLQGCSTTLKSGKGVPMLKRVQSFTR